MKLTHSQKMFYSLASELTVLSIAEFDRLFQMLVLVSADAVKCSQRFSFDPDSDLANAHHDGIRTVLRCMLRSMFGDARVDNKEIQINMHRDPTFPAGFDLHLPSNSAGPHTHAAFTIENGYLD